MKNVRVFLSENFQFLEVKFSIYLNRRVFVMCRKKGSSAISEEPDQPACTPCLIMIVSIVFSIL